ncbi:hypothetical protein F5B22DRAFT_637551 [Xylaria bambusicola]|uniref:uncharacterized protein n=1 Tax=Xylaria bambusicola TaxID=326684 RepID=UPI0020081DC6|nr:uncharacterized protein F5B22DRAFT_637551 [Xylaria bambusicola]KAI0512734.1 hypothetical protein F5B22DRAFT_637551 [Xylaria bambusicola]
MSKAILVTGATGRQGSAVIEALLNQKLEDFTILAVTRNVSQPAAQKLRSKSRSIKLVEGDLDDIPAIFKQALRVAEQPLWGVYSVQVSLGKGVTPEGEIKQGEGLIDESIKAGVKHFVYSSVERGGDDRSWDNRTPVPHFQTKYEIEHHLRKATAEGKAGESMGWTILRPVAFMDNLFPGVPTRVFLASLRNWLGDKSMQWIAVRDIGNFAAQAFTDTQKWNRKAVGLAGDELNMDDLSKAFESVTGQPAPMAYSFFGSALTFVSCEVRTMIGWFASDGYKADVEARRADYPDILTFKEWLDLDSTFETAE